MRHYSRKLKIEHVPDIYQTTRCQYSYMYVYWDILKIARIAKSKSDAAFWLQVRTDLTFEFWIGAFKKAYSYVYVTWHGCTYRMEECVNREGLDCGTHLKSV